MVHRIFEILIHHLRTVLERSYLHKVLMLHPFLTRSGRQDRMSIPRNLSTRTFRVHSFHIPFLAHLISSPHRTKCTSTKLLPWCSSCTSQDYRLRSNYDSSTLPRQIDLARRYLHKVLMLHPFLTRSGRQDTVSILLIH